MDFAAWIAELKQLGNTLSLAGVALTTLGLVAAWWFFYVPRRIQIAATASLPMFWMDPAKLPFTINAININTRQVKIKKIGFETVGRKSSPFELTIDASLFRTDKLLIAEGDNSELPFDGYDIASQIARSLRDLKLPLDPTVLRIWLYITHGRKIPVEVEANLAVRILDRITGASGDQ
jgi:hypothetical protein